AEVGGQQQERQPVADDLEAGEGGGVEPLPDHPVGYNVLDIVTHHGQPATYEVAAALGIAQRGELGRLPRLGPRGVGRVENGDVRRHAAGCAHGVMTPAVVRRANQFIACALTGTFRYRLLRSCGAGHALATNSWQEYTL